GGMCAVPLENVQNLGAALNVRAVVEGERDLRLRARPVEQDCVLRVVQVVAVQAMPPVDGVERLPPSDGAVFVVPVGPRAEEQQRDADPRAPGAQRGIKTVQEGWRGRGEGRHGYGFLHRDIIVRARRLVKWRKLERQRRERL